MCVREREREPLCHVCALLVHTSSAYFDETCEEDLITGENVPWPKTPCFCVIMKIYSSLNSGLAHLIILHNTGLLVVLVVVEVCDL